MRHDVGPARVARALSCFGASFSPQVLRLGAAANVLLTLWACGSKANTPAAPSPPPIPQVAGVWQAVSTLTGASGGECVGTLYQSVLGTTLRSTVAVTQNGSTINATSTSQTTGIACNMTGTIGSNNAFVLNVTSCQAAVLFGIRCLNGAIRDIELFASGINGTLTGSNTASGTEADSYNVYASGTRNGVGLLVLNSRFAMTR